MVVGTYILFGYLDPYLKPASWVRRTEIGSVVVGTTPDAQAQIVANPKGSI